MRPNFLALIQGALERKVPSPASRFYAKDFQREEASLHITDYLGRGIGLVRADPVLISDVH